MSEPKKPIVYYFDPAIPDPIRHAMKEGLLWWNKAFEAAGFKNAIEARDAPADMDPMDIRYAYVCFRIQRDERGFSSSGNYHDPRTGETLGSKTHMDTYCMRTIANYYDAYSGGYPMTARGLTIADPNLVSQDKMDKMSKGQRDMIYLRQALLTAHELGHTLGFQHNWAANMNNRSSVMEYPTPRVKVTNGKLDLSESFMTSIGVSDHLYGALCLYRVLARPGEGRPRRRDYRYARSRHYHSPARMIPRYTWYDDRETPGGQSSRDRRGAQDRARHYGTAMLQAGRRLGNLRDIRLWIVYLQQRYAMESAVKYIGGMFQNLTVKDEAHSLPPTEFIPAAEQREILGLLMDAVEPKNLEIPESLLIQLAPRSGGKSGGTLQGQPFSTAARSAHSLRHDDPAAV